ncbi:ATP-binding protein [Amycolatopsis nigrescens]|uniref:ATP-binding protein n=1 Tax=Amycolatopsis nigrescens TaxID=381445 RepID=UPI0003725B4F|nr:tetratricopeptide repeat protein [Amycolatopsis nigrescens]
MDADARNTAWLNTAETVVQAGTVVGGVHLHQAARQAPVVPRQLPFAPRWLVARERETADLTTALEHGTEASEMVLLAVEGQGGVGKSALALHWASGNLDRFPDGQLYADLGGFDPSGAPASPLSVLHGFLGAFGVAPAAFPVDQNAAAALYRSVLADKRVLVVLDNAADTEQVLPLLPGSPSGAVLVTSRTGLTGLRLRGATTLRLDVLPRDGARELLVRQLGGEAVAADPRAADLLLDCCAGLPLAVALVAARTAGNPDLPLSVVADELWDTRERLDAFDAGDGSADLRAALSWSYQALSGDQAGGFRLLGKAPAAELAPAAVASLLALPPRLASALLRSLEQKNLVRQHRPKRFRMHDLVRLYAAELADATDPPAELAAATQRLTDFYLHTAAAADRLLYPHRTRVELPPGTEGCTPVPLSDEAEALDWFAAEHQQILAVHRAAARHGWTERVWQLARALDTYQYRRGLLRDNVETARMGAAAAERTGSPQVRVLAYRQLGRACTRAGELDEALSWLTVALSQPSGQDDPENRAHTHHDLARAHSLRADHQAAIRHATAALELYQASGNTVGEAHALNAVGRQYAALGDHAHAHRCCAEALALHERLGNSSGTAATLDNLGFIAALAGRPEEAEQRYSSALELCRRHGNSYFEAEVTEHLADTQLARGRTAEGARSLRRTYRLYVAQHRLPDAERVRQRLAG